MNARMLVWTADLEDDLTDPGATRIFVPSIMGAGILVSIGILLGDLKRIVTPNAGEARRKLSQQRQALSLIAPIAEAIGRPAPHPPVQRRRLRGRIFYIALFVVGLILSLYVGIGSTFNYLRDNGPFSHKIWMESVSISASTGFFAVAVVALAVALRYPLTPRWARGLVERSPLGVLEE